jgi:hypothetical protein
LVTNGDAAISICGEYSPLPSTGSKKILCLISIPRAPLTQVLVGPVGVRILCNIVGRVSTSVLARCPRKYGNTWRVGGLMNFYDWEGPGESFKIVFHKS